MQKTGIWESSEAQNSFIQKETMTFPTVKRLNKIRSNGTLPSHKTELGVRPDFTGIALDSS
jgi:hypothetical protein